MVDATDATFEDVVLARSIARPVVVDLWAPWCGPCTTLGPMIERVVAATDGAVELVKVNVDENPAISASFRVQSIPAVFAIRDGAVVDQFIGAQPEEVVQAFVDRLAPVRSEADLYWPRRARPRPMRTSFGVPWTCSPTRRWPSRHWPRC